MCPEGSERQDLSTLSQDIFQEKVYLQLMNHESIPEARPAAGTGEPGASKGRAVERPQRHLLGKAVEKLGI